MNIRRLTFAVLSVGVLFACKGKEEAVDRDARFDVRKTSLEPSSGSVFISVSAKGEWSLVPEPAVSWAFVEPSAGNGSKGDVRLRYEANEDEDSRQLTLVLYSGGTAVFRAVVTQHGTSSGNMGRYGYDVAPMNWLELPAMLSGDGRELLIHDMDGRKYTSRSESGVRNWSCYWDFDEHLSIWVAYPLNNKLIGSGKRTDEWHFDDSSILPSNLQPDLNNNSYGGGWTRGHQIPSADRLNYNANVSTFVPTNMTPQEYNFNGGIWGNLEQKVRGYAAKSDTLYVVTGCLIADSKTLTGNSSGFAVKVPTHYFKALLFRGTSSYAHDGYMAAGFLLPHDRGISEGEPLDYIMSIDDLEKETGIDFFPNLAPVLGQTKADEIEAETPTKWWK